MTGESKFRGVIGDYDTGSNTILKNSTQPRSGLISRYPPPYYARKKTRAIFLMVGAGGGGGGGNRLI